MSRPSKGRATTKSTKTQGGRYITVVLTERDARKLRLPTTASGGINDLIRDLQRKCRLMPDGNTTLTIQEALTEKIVNYWYKTGGRPGSGGYQSRLPIDSLRHYLRTMAPLFADIGPPPIGGESWMYFKRCKASGLIKIGRGQLARVHDLHPTDSPNGLELLLFFPETRELDEDYWHTKFAELRVYKKREWFRPGEALLEWIDEEAAKQKLSEQRCCDDAGRPCEGHRYGVEPERLYS